MWAALFTLTTSEQTAVRALLPATCLSANAHLPMSYRRNSPLTLRDKWEAACTVCKPGTYVSVSNGGATDLKAHMDTEKHKKAVLFLTDAEPVDKGEEPALC